MTDMIDGWMDAFRSHQSLCRYIPIIASVSEHQPTTWSAYILDLHILILLAPIGLLVCFKHMTDGMVFAGLYGILSVYFSGTNKRVIRCVRLKGRKREPDG